MSAFGSMHSNSFCCSMAAAGTSAPKISLLDTALFGVVSICLVLVRICQTV